MEAQLTDQLENARLADALKNSKAWEMFEDIITKRRDEIVRQLLLPDPSDIEFGKGMLAALNIIAESVKGKADAANDTQEALEKLNNKS